VPQQPQIDPATGERIGGVEIDPETGERISKSGRAAQPAPAPKQSFLTKPIGEHSATYRDETKKLRSIAAGPRSEQEAAEDVKHPIKTGVRRFIAGSEADLADMLTPLFVGSSAVGALGEAPGAVGTAARAASRAGTIGFGAKGAVDVAKAGTENTPEAWARRLSGLSQMAATPAALGGLAPKQNRATRLSSGAGLTQGEESVKAIVPEFDKTLASQGKTEVKTIGDFQSLVKDTNGRLNDEYQSALKPVSSDPVDTRVVANSISGQITPNMLHTDDGQAIARELFKRSQEFEHIDKWTVEELDAEREKLAKSFRDASPSDVAADLKLKARVIADRAANGAINDILYSMADKEAGKPAGYFKALKQKQSVLFSMADDVKAFKDSTLASSAQKKGALLRETVKPHAYGHPAGGRIGATVGVVTSKLPFLDPATVANEKVRLAFRPPAPRSNTPGAALTTGAAAESVKPPAPKRNPTDEYSDPAQLQ
jgi:hypothetical protein